MKIFRDTEFIVRCCGGAQFKTGNVVGSHRFAVCFSEREQFVVVGTEKSPIPIVDFLLKSRENEVDSELVIEMPFTVWAIAAPFSPDR